MTNRPSPASGLSYRPDIDGLRALAVLPVVFFHFEIPGFRGGFVGVDVFFVISGYLITQLILHDLESGKFSIMRFYERRMRRILPALFAVVLAVVAISPLLLSPFDLKQTSQAVLGTATFTANFVFWRQSGYFAMAAQFKPLLHTWSLAVEEQYYLLYPPFLLLMRPYARRHLALVLFAGFATSFAGAIWLSYFHEGAAFYLSPARAWELLLGCLLALAPLPTQWPQGVREVLAILGISAIAYAVFAFSDDVRLSFPGVSALLPCGGAALLLYANSWGRTSTGRLLSSQPFVFVGLISYSLYLWHWPLLSFAQSLTLHFPVPPVRAILLPASVILAIISWRYIERPFRQSNGVFTQRKLFIAAGALTGVLCVVGLSGQLIHGWPERFRPEVAAISEYEGYATSAENTKLTGSPCHASQQDPSSYRPDICFAPRPGAKNILLFGDSHAAHLAQPLSNFLNKLGSNLLQATMSACPPVLDLKRSRRACREFTNFVRTRIGGDRIDGVILSADWPAYWGGAQDTPWPEMTETIRFFEARNIPVIFLGPSEEYEAPLSMILARYLASNYAPVFAPDLFFDPLPFMRDRELGARLGRMPGVTYVSIVDGLCKSGHCLALADLATPVIWDEGHFTRAGADLVVRNVLTEPLGALVGGRPQAR